METRRKKQTDRRKNLFTMTSGYGGNRQGNEQVASFLAPLGEEPGASRDLALWPI